MRETFPDSPHVKGLERFGTVSFIWVVVAAYITWFAEEGFGFPLSDLAVFVGLGVVYIIIALYGQPCFELFGLRPIFSTLIYFAIQISLTCLILYLGRASGFLVLIMMPLAADAAFAFSRRGVIAVIVLLAAAFGLTLRALGVEWGSVLPNAIALTSGFVFVALFTNVAIRESQTRARAEQLAIELAGANRQLSDNAAQVEELATSKERNRLAREIHDSLGHYLTVVNVQLEAAQALIESDPERAREALQKAQSLTKEGLADVRRSVATLRASPIEDRPLSDALAELLDEARASGLVAELAVTGSPRSIPAATKQALYRIAQEGLTNVRKHARASRADLTLDYSDASKVRLVLRDNGIGIVNGEHANGFGLIGVRERVRALGGDVRIDSRSGQGLALEVELAG